jgi:hypothetical protein
MSPRYFDDIEEKKRPHRALQIYQILIGTAANRQIITYGMLAEILGYEGAGVFAGTLDHIARWCTQRGLPSLTVLVVNQETGVPGEGIPVYSDIHAEREKVFRFKWYRILPPTADELEAASQSH